MKYIVLVQSTENFQYGDSVYGPFSLEEANLFLEKDTFVNSNGFGVSLCDKHRVIYPLRGIGVNPD